MVQTTEGEAISQLITGYVDIISQRKSPVHREPSKKGEHTMTATQWYTTAFSVIISELIQ